MTLAGGSDALLEKGDLVGEALTLRSAVGDGGAPVGQLFAHGGELLVPGLDLRLRPRFLLLSEGQGPAGGPQARLGLLPLVGVVGAKGVGQFAADLAVAFGAARL